MLLSLIARRMTLGAAATTAARTVCPTALSVVARRTLFVTPQIGFPSAKASEKATKKTTRKTAKEGASSGKRASPAKKARASKKSTEPPKQKRVRVPADLKPPKRAPGPYLLFFTGFLKSQPKAGSLEDFRELSKRASGIWNGYSMAEKQPFYDENEVRKEQAKREREEFFRNKSPSQLRALNAIRKAQGKPKVHSTNKRSIVSPFLSFLTEFRRSSDGQAVVSESSSDTAPMIRTAIAAGGRWRSMSPEEKAPYFERFKKAKEELKTGHDQS